MIHFPSHKNNALKLLRFNTSQKKLQSRTKYLEQNGVIQENWTGKEKFGICFLHIF